MEREREGASKCETVVIKNEAEPEQELSVEIKRNAPHCFASSSLSLSLYLCLSSFAQHL